MTDREALIAALNRGHDAYWEAADISAVTPRALPEFEVDAILDWLAEHDRQVAAKALRDAAEDIMLGDSMEALDRHGNHNVLRNAEAEASCWLEARAAQLSNDQGTIHDAYSSPDAAFDEMYADEITAHRAAVRARDNAPCPNCGGDRLRTDFTGSGKCHAPISSHSRPEEGQ